MQRGCVVKVTSTADRAVVSVEALLYGDGYGYGYGEPEDADEDEDEDEEEEEEGDE